MRRIFLFALTIFICSCGMNTGTKQTGAENKTREIHLVSMPDSVITKVSEIASDIEYIPLQPSAKTKIRYIDKIISRGNKIYLNLVDNIMCFDKQGHFLYKLYEKGKDRGEKVVAIYDFDIDESDTSLIVLYGNKLLHFKNTESRFDFIKTLNLGSISPSKLNFVPGKNNILLSTIRVKGYKPSFNLVINLDRDLLSFKPYYFKRFDPVKHSFWDEFIHYHFDNKLYFKERFNDTVFSITQSNNFTPELILNSRLSSTNSENINNPAYFRMLPKVVNIFEVPRYLYYAYYFSGETHQIFYDKYDEKKYELDTWNGFLKDDIAGGPDFYPEYCSDGKLFTWINARDLKKYLKSEDFGKTKVRDTKKQQELKELSLSLKESDNPVLILLKLKN